MNIGELQTELDRLTLNESDIQTLKELEQILDNL